MLKRATNRLIARNFQRAGVDASHLCALSEKNANSSLHVLIYGDSQLNKILRISTYCILSRHYEVFQPTPVSSPTVYFTILETNVEQEVTPS